MCLFLITVVDLLPTFEGSETHPACLARSRQCMQYVPLLLAKKIGDHCSSARVHFLPSTMNPLLVQIRQIVVICCVVKFVRHSYRWANGKLEEPEPVFDTVIPSRTRTGENAHAPLLLFNEDGRTFHLCNRTDVQFRIQPQHNVSTATVVVTVLSGPNDVERRAQFRRTHAQWGHRNASNKIMRIVFVVGESASHPDVQTQLEREAWEYDDILQLNHQDDYRSIYFKVLGGFVWVTRYCRAARYILKTDLGTVMNLDFLSQALARSLSQRQTNDLRIECAFPTTLAPVVRPTPYMNPNSIAGKWAISKEEMEQDVFPNYCTGFLYGVTSQAALALVEASVSVPWEHAASLSVMEDAFITGFLRQSIENMELQSMLNWWQRKVYEGFVIKCPFMAGVSNIFLNPSVKEKRSSEGVSYVKSPSYFFCSCIESLLRGVDVLTQEGYWTAPVWKVCARDNMALSRILPVFLCLSVLVAALLIVLCNTLVAALSWMRLLLVSVFSGTFNSSIVLLAPLLCTNCKQRTD